MIVWALKELHWMICETSVDSHETTHTLVFFYFHIGLVPQNRIFGTIEIGFYCQVFFLSTNQRRQSTEGNLGFSLHWLKPRKNHQHSLSFSKLDSMRWFSHRRSPSPPGGHAMVSSVAACCIWPSYSACPAVHCQWGWLSSISFFVLGLTFDLQTFARFLYSVPTAKFDRPTFSCLEVIVRTSKQTHWQTNRRCWKHPPRFAALCQWLIIVWLLATDAIPCTPAEWDASNHTHSEWS